MSTIAVIAAVLLAACGSSDDDDSGGATASGGGERQESIKIGVSFDVLNEIRKAEIQGIRDAAERTGSTVEFAVANDDPQRQAAQIQDLISAKQVDAIIAIAQNKDQIVSSIRAANRAGVPFFAIDREPAEGGEVTQQITGSPVEDGKLVGQYMVDSGEQLKVLHLLGALTDVNAIGRRDGFKEVVEGSDNVEIVQEAPTDWDPQKALDAVSNVLEKNPDINAIFAPSDFLLPSVLSALRAADRLEKVGEDGHIMVVTIDGDPVGCKALRDGLIDADVATLVEKFGETAVDSAIKAVNGETVEPQKVQVPGLLLDQENLESEAGKVWGCNAAG
jgi:ABC-type sugar transport system substrate-binding protein